MKALAFILTFSLISSGLVFVAGPASDQLLPVNASDWNIEFIPNTGGAHVGTSIDIFDDVAHMGYQNIFSYHLKYGERHENWTTTTLLSDGEHGGDISIKVDSKGRPHIAYINHTAKFILMHAFRESGFWTYEIVDHEANTSVGRWSSLSIDSGDRPHIAYVDTTNGMVKYARFNGSAWNLEVVAVCGSEWAYTSLDLDSHDLPHISFFNSDNGYVQYATKSFGIWRIENISFSGKERGVTSMVVDTSDVPNVAFRSDDNTSLMFARRTTSWQVETVDNQGYVGFFLSLAIEPSGKRHVSYMETVPVYDLKYAFFNGTVWHTEKVDTNGTVGNGCVIALDSVYQPHIVYYNPNNGLLKHAWKGEFPPPEPEEPSISLDIDPDTLNLKSKGRWITAYLSAENASVHDLDVSTILLQDALAPERWDYQDDVLMLKFDRQEFKDTVQAGESVQVKITGKWEDGTAFEAYDSIRVIWP